MTAPVTPRARRPDPGLLDRLFAPFAEVHAGEGLTAALLMINVFLLLTSYYVIKTVREPLILVGGGAEVKSYSAAGQAILLLFLVPLYGAFASRVNRARLITGVTLFFVSNLVVFYLLAQAKVPFLGVAFFLWAGIFNLMITAQFWAFANDVYTPEQGKRLFAIVGVGASLGAIVGAWLAKLLIVPLGVYQLMLVAAALLGVCIVLTLAVNARESGSAARARREAAGAAADQTPLGGPNGFSLVFRQRYLLLIALLTLVLNFVNTNGEYILGKTITQVVLEMVAAGQAGAMDPAEWSKQQIGLFYADFFWWVNVVGAVIQLFLVSRILTWFGVRAALFVLPLIALGGYGMLAIAPILGYVKIAKILENSTDYSLQNTARHSLFLPTSREAKYKAKAAIDSFFWRAGDLMLTGLVFVGTLIALTPRKFALINLGLVIVWLALVVMIGREHKRLTADGPGAEAR